MKGEPHSEEEKPGYVLNPAFMGTPVIEAIHLVLLTPFLAQFENLQSRAG